MLSASENQNDAIQCLNCKQYFYKWYVKKPSILEIVATCRRMNEAAGSAFCPITFELFKKLMEVAPTVAERLVHLIWVHEKPSKITKLDRGCTIPKPDG